MWCATDYFPEFFGLSGVGAESDRDPVVRNEQAHRRHNVIHVYCLNSQMRYFEFLADLKGHILHHASALVLQLVKPRIDIVIEDVALQQIDHLSSSVNADWLFQFAEKIIHKNRQAGDMIQ